MCDPEPASCSELRPGILACLAEAIDRAPVPRKVLADDAALTEQQLSKVLAGAQGIPAGLFDSLPLPVLVDFLRRYGLPRGIDVRELEPAELTEQVIEAARHLVQVATLATVRGRAVRAALKR